MLRDRRFRVAYVLPQLNRAGTQKQVVELASGMANRGHTVKVIMLEEGRAMADELSETVEVVCCGFAASPRSPANLAAVSRFFRQLKNFHPDVIHTYLLWPNIWGALVSSFIPSAALITSRRNLAWYKEESAWLRRFEDLTNLRACVVVANSRAVQADTERWEPRARAKVRVIYNGIRPKICDDAGQKTPTASDIEQIRTKHGASAQDSVLVSVANLHHYKGHGDLLAATSLLKERGRSIRLWLIGEDRGHEATIRREVERLGLERQVVLLGRRDDVESFLAAADVGLLCPSHNEGMSNALLEYMIWGLPAVVTDVGGNAECVSNGESGFVIPTDRPDLLADRVDQLIDSPSMRRAFGEEAVARVHRMFDMDRMVEEYEQLYLEATAQQSHRPLLP